MAVPSSLPLISRSRFLIVCLLAAIVAQNPSVSNSAEEKKLSVYTPKKTYSLSVTDDDKTEYTGLFELLEPLGKLQRKENGSTFRLKLDDVEGEFSDGKKLARIGKTQVLLSAKAVADHGRLLVPVRSITGILEKYLGQRPEFHESGRRLFIGTSGESFTVEIKRPENSLLLTFPAAVTPTVSTEGGRVHMVFTNDPVIFGADSLGYNDKLITSVNLAEHNGAAEITVSGTAPLAATLGDDGRTISVSAASAAAATEPVPGLTPASATNMPPQSAVQAPLAVLQKSLPPLPAGTVHFFVMIDAAHGGTDFGARFSDKLLEKDITLAIARKLRAELQGRGVSAVLLRDGDTSLTYDQRAVSCNAQRAGLYVAIHAGVPGTGVRVYTAMLPGVSPDEPGRKRTGPFVPVDTAQSAYLERSRMLAGAVVKEMADANIRSGAASAPLLPLNRVAAPALAIEVALPSMDAKPDTLNAPKYQQRIAEALASGIVDQRAKLEVRP